MCICIKLILNTKALLVMLGACYLGFLFNFWGSKILMMREDILLKLIIPIIIFWVLFLFFFTVFGPTSISLFMFLFIVSFSNKLKNSFFNKQNWINNLDFIHVIFFYKRTGRYLKYAKYLTLRDLRKKKSFKVKNKVKQI